MEESRKIIKFIYLRVLLSSIFIGFAYGIISHFNPYIYVDIIFLAVTIAILLFLMKHIMQHGKKKSTVFYFIYGILICLMAWLTSWATYYVFDTDDGLIKIFTQPAKFFGYIIGYAHRNSLSISHGSTKIRMHEAFMAILYLVELIIFLLPSLEAFRKDKTI